MVKKQVQSIFVSNERNEDWGFAQFYSCEDWRVENNAKYEYPTGRLCL